MQINLALLKEKQQPVPDVEWWDSLVLADSKAYGEEDAPQGAQEKIGIYIEHPKA